MSTQADLGAKALAAKDYTSAISYYTTALKSSNSPLWLTQRSTAYHRSGQYEAALRDAEAAVLAAHARARRELIASAQMRRAIALYSLGQLGNARLALTWVRKLNEKEKSLGVWQLKIANDYEKLPEDAVGRKITIKEMPEEVKEAEVKEAEVREAETPKGKGKEKPDAVATAPAPTAPSAAVQTPKEKIRHEWFQSSNNITITIFAKGIPKDQVEVAINPQSLEIRFPTGPEDIYDFTLDPLYSPINQSGSSISITPHKLEVVLPKATPGLKWPALEGTTRAPLPTTDNESAASTAAPSSTITDHVPVYPTSSKHGPKNWDALAKSALAAESTGQEKLGDDDDDEGDPLHGFFKKLYKDADPDTKRAMMKSYTESNGTALSTNWEDVQKKKVETSPPEGLEAKKWEK